LSVRCRVQSGRTACRRHRLRPAPDRLGRRDRGGAVPSRERWSGERGGLQPGRSIASNGGTRWHGADLGRLRCTELLTISVDTAGLGAVEFFPDGRHIAVGTLDGLVRTYTLDVEELRAIAESRVTRSLTPEEYVRFNFDPCPATMTPSP
jgi:hypothetical protein